MSNPPGVRTLVDGLDGQLATQHTAIMTALDALLSALGVPPPTSTITLANIDTRLLAINTLLTSDLATISEQLQQIYLLLANSIAPNLENVFFALNDLYALQAGAGNPRVPALPSTTNLPTGAELLHCQRVQWMIDEFFNTWMDDIGLHLTAVGGVGAAVVLAALPLPVLEGGAIPIALLSSAVYALVQVLNLSELSNAATASKKAALRQALYAAPNAQAAQAAWNATVDGFSDVEGSIRNVWKALIWADWFNHLYDATNHNSTTEPGKWDLDGYDGSVCAPIAPGGTWYGFETTPTGGTNYLIYDGETHFTHSAFTSGVFGTTVYPHEIYLTNTLAGMKVRCDGGQGLRVRYSTDNSTIQTQYLGSGDIFELPQSYYVAIDNLDYGSSGSIFVP